jgi:hypothetical protein
MIESIRKFILEHPALLPAGVTKEVSIKPLLITKGHGKNPANRRVTILWFAEGAREPYLSARFCWEHSFEWSLQRELEACSSYRNEKVTIVPEPLGIFPVNGRQVYFEKTVAGTSLTSELFQLCANPNRTEHEVQQLVERHFSIALQAIKRLNTVRKPAASAEAGIEIDSLIEYLNEHAGKGEGLPSALLLKTCAMSVMSKKGLTKRIVDLDFIPANVFVEKDNISVIDWEHSRVSTLFPLEPIRFTAYYFRHLEEFGVLPSADLLDLYFTLQSSHWFAAIARKFLCEALEIPDDELTGEYLRGLILLHLLNEYYLQSESANTGLVAYLLPMVRYFSCEQFLYEGILEVKRSLVKMGAESANTLLQMQTNVSAMAVDRDKWKTDYLVLEQDRDRWVEIYKILEADRNRWQKLLEQKTAHWRRVYSGLKAGWNRWKEVAAAEKALGKKKWWQRR